MIDLKDKNINLQIIYDAPATKYHRFMTSDGLDKLRDKIESLKSNEGIILLGDVGITSHFGQILRYGKIPSYLTKDLNYKNNE